MSQVGYIILGWLLGILTMLITLWIQTKAEKEKKEIEILSETLKYLFRTKQTYNNLLTDKSALDKTRKEFPQKASELERLMYENFDKDIKEGFFPELMFHSFQLKRLDDKSFLRDFDIVMNKFETFGNRIMEQSNNDVISDINTETLELMKAFVEKCNAKAKL
jgi:hypothetical protein